MLVPFLTEDSEELDPGGGGSSEQCSGSEGNKENSPQPGGKGVLLSRRQKKNRVRRDDGSPVASQNGSASSAKKNKAKARRSANTGDGNGNSNRRHIPNAPVLRQHTKLNLADSDLSVFLRQYILNPDELLALGYPVESSLYPGRAIIYKSPNTKKDHNPSSHVHPNPLQTSSHFDVNAQEFVPMSAKQPKVVHYYSDNDITCTFQILYIMFVQQ